MTTIIQPGAGSCMPGAEHRQVRSIPLHVLGSPPLLPWNSIRTFAVTGHRPHKIELHRGIPCLGDWRIRLYRYAKIVLLTLMRQQMQEMGEENNHLTDSELLRQNTATHDHDDPFRAPRWTPPTILTGMAVGWDQAIANACIELGFPFIAYIPCIGQERSWPQPVRAHYHQLLSRAKERIVVSTGKYEAWKMHARDRRMVDDSQGVLAFWNGEHGGGTDETLKYALQKKRPTLNAWPFWAEHVYITKEQFNSRMRYPTPGGGESQ